MVAAAVIGAGLITATASGVAGSEAAGATRDATNASISQQQSALNQQAQLSAPYRDLGESAIDKYKALLGLGPNGAAGMGPTLESTPGYAFAKEQGTKGITNAASLAGGVSGNTLADLDKFNVGLADSTYQSTVDNLGRAVGTGQAAAAGQAQNVGTAAGTISSDLVNQGNTLAGIDANTVAGLTKSFGNTTNNLVTLEAIKGQGGSVQDVTASGGQLWS